MDLPTYKRAFRVKYLTIARAVGVTPATISFIASGHRRPSQKLADKIELATDRQVSAAELRREPQSESADQKPNRAGGPTAPNGGPIATEPNRAADHPADHAGERGVDRGDNAELEPGIAPGATAGGVA
jgi:hypothetical protein